MGNLVRAVPGTIAQGYINAPDTCQFLSSPVPQPLATTHWGEISGDGNPSDSIILQIYPSYRFDGATNFLGWSEGPVFPPDRVTMPYDYCGMDPWAYSPIATQPDWPIPTTLGCDGDLLYGYEDIPLIPIDTTIGQNGTIVGQQVHRLDPGGPGSQFRGTITWFRPPLTCLTPNLPTFRVLLNATGEVNRDSPVAPILYQDSATGQIKYCPVYGLGCGGLPRPVASPPFDPQISVIPICRQVMPFSVAYTVADYEAVFGVGVRGPNNVPQNAVVYQIRVDRLDVPIGVQVTLLFDYVDGASGSPPDTIAGPFIVNQATIYYVASMGVFPASVKQRLYNPTQPFVEIWNEVNLLYLDACNCNSTGGGSGNVICDADPEPNMLSPVPRASVPNYNIPPAAYADSVTCTIYVNNGQPVYAGVAFTLDSAAVTSWPPILVQYLWQFSSVPPGSSTIVAPTASTTTATLSVVGIATVNLTMSLLPPGPAGFQNCSQTITVLSGAPTASLIPQSATIPLFTFLVLDGSASTSPPTFGALTWAWAITFGPVGGGTLSSTSLPTITFSASLPGIYTVSMTVTNNVGYKLLLATINVQSAATPISPPDPCFNLNPAPFEFVVPPNPPPSPVTPAPPTNPPLAPAFNGILGPVFAIPPSTVTFVSAFFIIVIVIILLLATLLIVYRALYREAPHKRE